MKRKARFVLELLRQGDDPAQIVFKLALREALTGCESVLDAGCGVSSLLRRMGIPRLVGVEGYPPAVERANALKTHDEIIHGNVQELDRLFQPGQFDACTALDVIEHLSKADGVKLMKNLERIARKRVILFTPGGFLPQRHAANDDLQEHLSGWEAAEMAGYGYQVFGMLGPKRLRGEFHAIKGRPRVFWAAISLLAQLLWTRSRPETAAAILCIKNLTQPQGHSGKTVATKGTEPTK